MIQKMKEILSQLNDSIDKTLIILNGECTYNELEVNNMMNVNHTFNIWNEAMCWGNSESNIFSESFINTRIKSLNTTSEDYERIVLKPLRDLLEEKFDNILCFFGEDMFCQINMLTLLAYLDQIQYEGKVISCVFDENDQNKEILVNEIDIHHYSIYYKKIICEKENIELSNPVLNYAKDLYLSYQSLNSEINQYIIKHINEDERSLVYQLMNQFPQYGLGDLQYFELIRQIKTNY